MSEKEYKMRNVRIENIFRKGDLVQAVPVGEHDRHIKGFYHLTEQEREDSRAEQRRAIRAGEIDWHDSAGEPRLTRRHAYQELNPDVVYEVIRGRCRVERGYHMASGQVMILDTENGRELYCERDELRVVG
jgi:hypothetical protein